MIYLLMHSNLYTFTYGHIELVYICLNLNAILLNVY